jgi:asparagine synthase (glutamine-hydrolysing)
VCGLAGLVDPTFAGVDRPALERMTRALARRGPDGEGFWYAPGVGLGHRRLRVIDLSAAADQPLGEGPVRVVYNGEIYNFADLRAELMGHGCAFRTRSDTEVLVHGYTVWGDAVIDRLEGMFAFALWDGRRRRLLAARDRMGKKPFYWAQIPRPGLPPLFAFASELKGLLPVPGLDRAVSPTALASYLSFEHVPPPLTIIAGAHKLDAGEKLTLELGGDPGAAPAVARYWSLPFPERPLAIGEDEAAETLRDLLRRAVERRLVADVPLGAFLSGGLDSGTVVALMAELGGAARVKTYSIGFEDPRFDESAQARALAAELGTDHHEERLGPRDLALALPAVGDFLDEPLGDASILPTYLLCRFARTQVTVALSGDGGDELFEGYPTFLADPVARALDRLPLARRLAGRAAAWLPAGAGYFSLDFQLRQFLRGGALPGPPRHQRWLASFLPEELPGVLATNAPVLAMDLRARAPRDRLMEFYARYYLGGGVNVKVDRASGAVGLEVRAPFLDTDVVSFACAIPAHMRRRGTVGKWLLRRALRGRLSDDVIRRPKRGFAVPVARWLREELAPALRDELAPDKLRREGFLQPAVVTRLVDEHLSGRRDHRKQLWTLFVFERWLARWGGTTVG